MGAPRTQRASIAVAQQHVVLAAIARREWLLRMLALAAAGCQSGRDRAYARGNTLIVGIDGGDKEALNPDEVPSTLMFLPFVRLNEQGERQACLATSWEHSADYLEWTYRLRPDVRWHDGTPVTVDDVKWTVDLWAQADFLHGTECTVDDTSTVTVRGGNWAKDGGHGSNINILPKHLLKDLDRQRYYDWDFWLRPVGNGPYRFLRYQPGTMAELEANPDYYKGKPRIERVVLKFTQGASLTELLGGNVDAIGMSDTSQLSVIANDTRFQTYWWPSATLRLAIVWQNEHPLFRESNVRRALSLGINRRELVQLLNLPSQCSLVDGIYTRRQLQRGEVAEPRYDPAEARRLLDASGWRQPDRDALRVRNGRDFRFAALTQPGLWNKAAVYVQDQLRALGVGMEVQPVDLGVIRSRLRAGDFEVSVCKPSNVWTLYDMFKEPSPIGYRNRQLTSLLDLAERTADPDALEDTYRKVSDLLRTEEPVSFLSTIATAHIVHRRVKGISGRWPPDALMFTEDLWLDDRDASG